MFIDILIVSILTTVWLETLMRPICHLFFQKFFRSNCLFVTLKPRQILQAKELCYYKPKTKHSFFDDNRQQVCGLLKICSVFGKILQFLLITPKNDR